MVQQTGQPRGEQHARELSPFCGDVRSSQHGGQLGAGVEHPGLAVRRACGLQWAPLILQCPGAAPRVSVSSGPLPLALGSLRHGMFTHLLGHLFVLWFRASGSLLPPWPRQSALCSAWGQRLARERHDPNRFLWRQAVGYVDRVASYCSRGGSLCSGC